MMSHGYALFTRPNAWLRNKPMTVRLVYDAVASLVDMGNGGYVSLSLARLMQMTQRARRTVLRAVKRLTRARLLYNVRERVGRGAVYVFKVAAFYTNPKWTKKGQSIQTGSNVEGNSVESFPQKKVPPVLPIGPRNTKNLKSLKTAQSVRLSPGRIMGMARKTTNQNPQLSPTQRKAIMGALGRMVFKLGYLAELRQTPAILSDLLKAMAHRSPLGPINPKETKRSLFARAMALLVAVVARQTGQMTQRHHYSLACPEAAGYPRNRSFTAEELAEYRDGKEWKSAVDSVWHTARTQQPQLKLTDHRDYERRRDDRQQQRFGEQNTEFINYSLIGESQTGTGLHGIVESSCSIRHKTHNSGVCCKTTQEKPNNYGIKAGSTGRALSSPRGAASRRPLPHRFHKLSCALADTQLTGRTSNADARASQEI